MGRPKLTKQEIISQVNALGLTFIRFINYDGKESEFIVRCEYNHDEYKTNLNILNKGRKAKGCPYCKYINKIQTNIDKVGYDNVKLYCENLGFTLLTPKEEYKGISSNLQLICDKGHKFTISFANLKKRENKCSDCLKEERINKAKNRANELNYTLFLLDHYENKNDKLDILCDKGHSWHPTYDSFVNAKNKCLFCQYSKGEEVIEKILIENSIEYINQYQFDDCIYKRKLRYDFYLPDFNTCIEFDGIQHYEPQDYFGGDDSFEDLHCKDMIKNEYCQKNNINLIRIPYYELDNIEIILKHELNLN